MSVTADYREHDYDAAIRDFGIKLGKYTIEAVCGRQFIFISRLREWLKSKVESDGSAITQVGLLRDAAYRLHPGTAIPISVEQLCDLCLLVFSILLEMKHGSFIHGFLRRDKMDKNLPIDVVALKELFEAINAPNPDELAENFNSLQWKYCPARFEWKIGKDFAESRIIPIVKMEKIKQGGTAQLWQIEVPEEFIDGKLREAVKSSRLEKADNIGPSYNFALKKFEQDFMVHYKNEKEAFIVLQENASMVRYLCEYSHDETRGVSEIRDDEVRKTYNIILEYGQDDLDEHFTRTLPPVLRKELVSFWKDLSEVADAVKGIHKLKTNAGGWDQDLRGCHADIKPENILVVHGKFKLADPGFAKFIKTTNAEPILFITGGTETYGAPERHQGMMHAVGQTIDIWSLGCVFSIAATWVVLGDQGVRQFSKLREKAIDKIVGEQWSQRPDRKSLILSRGDYFYDGREVLPEVTEWHDILRDVLRKNDTITSRVLDLVDTKMLRGNAAERCSAANLCEDLANIIAETQAKPYREIPEAVMNILLEVDEDATSRPTQAASPETITEKTQPLTIGEERKARKSKLLSAPLMKTTHRSEHRKIERKFSVQEDRPVLPRRPDSSVATSATLLSPTLKQISRPAQNVWQARQALLEGNTGRFRRQKKDEPLAKHYDKRYIKFLVDNADSMEEHWFQAGYLLETLLLKLSGLEGDGIDLMFTHASTHNLDKQKDRAKILKQLNIAAVKPGASVQMQTDMRKCLGDIFDNYLKKADNKHSKNQVVKNLAVIVLTDGLWAGTKNKNNNMRQKIIEFLAELRKATGGVQQDRPVSIEFIQFGKGDTATTYMLEALYIKDVVDREPCDGDINKMLLGSLVDSEELEEREWSLPGATNPQSHHYQHYHSDSPTASYSVQGGPPHFPMTPNNDNQPLTTPRTLSVGSPPGEVPVLSRVPSGRRSPLPRTTASPPL